MDNDGFYATNEGVCTANGGRFCECGQHSTSCSAEINCMQRTIDISAPVVDVFAAATESGPAVALSFVATDFAAA